MIRTTCTTLCMQTPLIPKNTNFRNVYEPAGTYIMINLTYLWIEDTFLLIDVMEKDMTEIRLMSPTFVLEIGSGSGCVVTFMAKNLQQPCSKNCFISS